MSQQHIPEEIQLQGSIFAKRTMAEILADIRAAYLSNTMPWVIGYSGGKDSTAALQLVWYALRDLPREQFKPIHIIATDTLVETPVIVDHVNGSLSRMRMAAEQQGLPIEVHRLTPDVAETFWVNLIGRGYPAPHSRFRWCTERMKIRPADTFILSKVAEYGEVVLVLGQRLDESQRRAQSMSSYRITGTPFSRNSTLPKAYVYTPIEAFTVNDVWKYLGQVPPPWGGDNRYLASLYRSANSGECPMVLDLSTPSCGSSRFGCWVCTVVTKDKAMEAMIDNGEEWMVPMLEFRDFLAATQEFERKHEVRDYRRRDGLVKVRKQQGTLIRGPYRFSFRQELLERLLVVQQQVREDGPDPDLTLISLEELYQIRRLWRAEANDWEDSVPQIYQQVTGEALPLPPEDTVLFGSEERGLLAQVCAEGDVPIELLMALIESQRQQHTLRSRTAIHARIDEILRSEWRSEQEVLEAVEQHQQRRADLDNRQLVS
ncbi:MAG: 3'-phosphoadenosine 5'-phosphosulfate sulfotransferase (PAPS reductase)/FAD synthetase [Chloroflexi bacterium AL-W]|nr:3'-phosphoadenosine 5'-phosphosulfate sulfotransferase (PAPS reductase)/FAD synthetase [Chloroflexi bacterium AL-N1]NOK71042.1 3'-phosphoadenosine 5'-phosphosulfate sulfotransferase (PAPS reductase)/FAD synthetase [Chloroflexi bacterium AL-N10]NOK72735.1 3'-phosphoadenosine 5'-phosphosulfate sulfotransferase (PAPS reductase)/FAD synthetase [Chloroflexi bacterium AL-N5]NOK79177.1 3'-phosphoadenosine 5'-phosphosulfate sulfotransferase (PAPS reductase)/FAD synthetase [Chloroflexi bacterium AL-W]